MIKLRQATVILSVILGIILLRSFYLTVTVLSAVCFIYLYDLYAHSYWKRRNISSPPADFVYGHVNKLYSIEMPRWEFLDQVYKTYKHEGVCGLYEYFQPALLVMDPAIAKNILIKDFDHFTERWTFDLGAKNDEVNGNMLSTVSGQRWKKLRPVVTPVFSTLKIRTMFDIITGRADDFVTSCNAMLQDGVVPMGKAWRNFTLDVIATCAFGIDLKESGTLRETFLKHAEGALPFVNARRFALYRLSPKLFSILGLRLSATSMDYFVNLGKELIQKRKQDQVRRGDFMDLLLDALSKGTEDSYVTEGVVAAQVTLFLLAGYGTTVNALLYSSFMLAKHPEFQEKLRKEVKSMVNEEGELNYEKVMQNKLLKAFIYETLRLYPVTTFVQRKCTRHYRIPGKSLEIRSGTVVIIPSWSIQRDGRYWPDPEAFKPERFLESDNANNVTSTFLSFGNGPRNCLGKRFAILEMRIVLAKLLLNFKLTIANGYEEMKFKWNPILLKPASEFYVNMSAI